jgi:hypothetical protein
MLTADPKSPTVGRPPTEEIADVEPTPNRSEIAGRIVT